MLNSKQRSHLAGLAHTAPDLLQLGKAGPTEGFMAQLDRLLEDHELVKLRFVDYKESRQELARELAEKSRGELVRVIGNTAIFFRRNPDPKKRKVEFE